MTTTTTYIDDARVEWLVLLQHWLVRLTLLEARWVIDANELDDDGARAGVYDVACCVRAAGGVVSGQDDELHVLLVGGHVIVQGDTAVVPIKGKDVTV